MVSSHLLLILEFQTHIYIFDIEPSRRAVLKCESFTSHSIKLRVEGVQHEPEENVQKPLEGVHDLVEGVHDPVESVHDPVLGVDAVEGIVEALALAFFLALSFLSALALFLISSRRGSSRRK